jgi:phosphatidylglycerophosphatase A
MAKSTKASNSAAGAKSRLHFFPTPINRAMLTWFGCGKVPVAPGTAGSIGALPFCWLFLNHTSLAFRILMAIGFTAIAILGAAQDQAESPNKKDPQDIVADEVAGMLFSICGIRMGDLSHSYLGNFINQSFFGPYSGRNISSELLSFYTFCAALFLAFLLFRIFDAGKPWPVSWLDRKSKKAESFTLRGAFIVLDDVAAGILTALVLCFATWPCSC